MREPSILVGSVVGLVGVADATRQVMRLKFYADRLEPDATRDKLAYTKLKTWHDMGGEDESEVPSIGPILEEWDIVTLAEGGQETGYWGVFPVSFYHLGGFFAAFCAGVNPITVWVCMPVVACLFEDLMFADVINGQSSYKWPTSWH